MASHFNDLACLFDVLIQGQAGAVKITEVKSQSGATGKSALPAGSAVADVPINDLEKAFDTGPSVN